MFLVIKVFPDMRLPPLSSIIGFVSFIIFSRGSHPYTPPLSGLSFPERCHFTFMRRTQRLDTPRLGQLSYDYGNHKLR
jgi:hypothetical protein